MKRWAIIALFSIFISVQLNAQDGDKFFLRIQYNITGKEYLEENKQSYKDLFNLDIGSNLSLFYSFNQHNRDSVELDLKKQGFAGLQVKETLNERGYFQGRKDILITDIKSGNHKCFSIIGVMHYSAAEPVENIKWYITNDTTTIFNYKCFKAKSTFRGRTWIAWFTREVPVSRGPWKLSGLPGLILRASDSDNHYVFEIAGVSKISKVLDMSLFEKYKEVSIDEFNKLMIKSKTDPMDFVMNQTGRSIGQGYDREGKPIPKSRFQNLEYNPIER